MQMTAVDCSIAEVDFTQLCSTPALGQFLMEEGAALLEVAQFRRQPYSCVQAGRMLQHCTCLYPCSLFDFSLWQSLMSSWSLSKTLERIKVCVCCMLFYILCKGWLAMWTAPAHNSVVKRSAQQRPGLSHLVIVEVELHVGRSPS
jgi:hypothetical protein